MLGVKCRDMGYWLLARIGVRCKGEEHAASPLNLD